MNILLMMAARWLKREYPLLHSNTAAGVHLQFVHSPRSFYFEEENLRFFYSVGFNIRTDTVCVQSCITHVTRHSDHLQSRWIQMVSHEPRRSQEKQAISGGMSCDRCTWTLGMTRTTTTSKSIFSWWKNIDLQLWRRLKRRASHQNFLFRSVAMVVVIHKKWGKTAKIYTILEVLVFLLSVCS